MEILSLDYYTDGGTQQILTDLGEFCIDNRIKTNTRRALYKGHPENGELVNDDSIKIQLIRAIENYKEKPREWSRKAHILTLLKINRDQNK